ncbi:hypothetical protein [Pedobacter sp. Hv1]|uniref:hypothetical protein n=1 Tax=Pedobacter sp. Hv1 TaxID=1740090 RepID=UPI0006D8D41A|nr:hypothetical protein [Pedobacter sp. Hv1]KQC00835.1 hypothetical protein AQF98_09150 [Pedobacter sp. Hv1]
MKTIIYIFALTLLMLFCISVKGQTKTGTVINVKDLKKDNCKDPKQEELGKNDNFYVTINFPDKKEAERNQANYKLQRLNSAGTPSPLLEGKVSNTHLTFIYNAALQAKGDKDIISFKILYIKDAKDPAKNECQYEIKLVEKKTGTPTGDAETPKIVAPAVDYLAIAKKHNFNVNLSNLDIVSECCPEDVYPCLEGESITSFLDTGKNEKLNKDTARYKRLKQTVPRNRIFYDAKANQTYFVDNKGDVTRLSAATKRKFHVKGGDPLGFEIINVNPNIYKLDINESSESLWQNTNALLARYFSPFDGVAGEGASDGPDEKENRIDVVRAGILTMIAALNDFWLGQQSACDNLNFKLTYNKIEAKKRVDAFLHAQPMAKSPTLTLNEFLKQELKIAKEDSTLYKTATQLYNKLIGTYIHMLRNTRAATNKDRIDFKFSILAKEGTAYIDKVKEMVVPVPIIGNFKVDVSSGLYYAPFLKDHIYSLKSDYNLVPNRAGTGLDTLKGKRIKDDGSSGEFGFVSYLHFYNRCSVNFSWGWHLGAGVSLNDQIRPRYFTGLSFLLGKENGRIALNIGAVMGNVNRISNRYEKVIGDSRSDFELVNAAETSVSYVKKFKIAPAIGITYNIPFSLKKGTQEEPVSGTKK